jgi:hypothetical protein
MSEFEASLCYLSVTLSQNKKKKKQSKQGSKPQKKKFKYGKGSLDGGGPQAQTGWHRTIGLLSSVTFLFFPVILLPSTCAPLDTAKPIRLLSLSS